MKSGLLAAVTVGGLLLAAPASAQGVKIGILNDQSGVYADYGGKWSFEAAKMAIEDFGGSVLGQKIEIVSADHQNKPDLATAIARRAARNDGKLPPYFWLIRNGWAGAGLLNSVVRFL